LFWSVLVENDWFQILLALHEGTYGGCWIDLSKTVVWLWSVESKIIIRLKVFLLLLLNNPLKAVNQIFIIFVGFKNIKA
jgi:hypothetical protein